MTAPVIFYMFLNVFSPLIVGDQFITTLIFKEPVRAHSGVSKNELYVKESNDRKMLFIKSMGSEFSTNLNIVSDSGQLYSFLITRGEKPHSLVTILNGKKHTQFRKVKNIRGVDIEESPHSIKITNNRDVTILVNEINLISKTSYEFSGGAPIFINNKRVYR